MKKDSLLPKRCERLKRLRGSKTQKEMSVLLDVTEKTYRSWEKGEYRKGHTEKVYPYPDSERLIKMSEIFHCSIDYLLCRSDCTSVDNHYISLKIGLSDDAINGLRLLHFPIDSIWDSVQISRYDIIALNLILEDFYSKMIETPDYRKFGDETDTLLNRIGQYIDSGSGAIDIGQNGKLSLYSSDEIVQAICRDKITLLLKELRDKYSTKIIGRRNENKERFQKLYEDSVKKYLANNENQNEKN